MAAGVGSLIDVKLGGRASKLGGASEQGKAYVKSIGDGRYAVRFSAWPKAGFERHWGCDHDHVAI